MAKDPKIKFVHEDEATGEEIEVLLPARYEVCGRCLGRGSHVNPSIDGHGISEDEWNGPDWDDESQAAYLSGGYDVACHECKGDRVVAVIDEDACEPMLLKLYREQQVRITRHEAEDRYWARMESGGYE